MTLGSIYLVFKLYISIVGEVDSSWSIRGFALRYIYFNFTFRFFIKLTLRYVIVFYLSNKVFLSVISNGVLISLVVNFDLFKLLIISEMIFSR